MLPKTLSTVFLGLLVLLEPASAQQRTIHAFTVFCDAYSGQGAAINKSVAADRLIMKSLLTEHYSEKGWGVKLNHVVISGSNANKPNIEKRFAELTGKIGPSDTVFVYFSGHGIILDPSTKVQMLQTCDTQLINRNAWAGSIDALPCQLKILVTDCCSSYPPGLEIAEGDEDVKPWETLYQLLLRHEGFVNITAASPGQYAYGTTNGGYLTVNLHSDMQRYSTWAEVFKETESRVFEETTAGARASGDASVTPQRPKAYSLGRRLRPTGQIDDMPDEVHYVLPNSNTQKMDRSELEQMGMQQLYFARNEIMARHGYDFSTPLLQDYFASRRWYRLKSGVKDPALSPIETYNAQLILEVEKSMGGPFLTVSSSAAPAGNGPVPDIFPYSSERVLPRSVVQTLSLRDLSIARNEIFARHGYPFVAQGLQDHFARKPWYRRNPRATDPPLNEVEQHNLWLIKKIERLRGGAFAW